MSTTVSAFEGQNFLQPTGFRISINRKRFKNFDFFAQSVTHPSVTATSVRTPFRGTDLQSIGDKLEYSPLTVEAIVDENMNVYKEMLGWLEKSVRENFISPSRTGLQGEDRSQYDIKLLILSSNNNPIDTITYKDAFPVDVGGINFQTNTGGVQYITFPITFAYTTFEITQ